MYCVKNSYSLVISTLNNPFNLAKIPNDLSFYTILFHAYHILLCGKLSLDETIHHLLVFILCPLLWVHYTTICDFAIFFMTGLPGGITYLCLFLKDLGLINGITEKYISKHLNMWIRGPGGVITSYIIYLNYVNNNLGEIYPMKKFAIYLSIAFNLWNGMYFASTIIESYKVNAMKNEITDTNPNNFAKYTIVMDKISNIINKICFSKEMLDHYKPKINFSEWFSFKKKDEESKS